MSPTCTNSHYDNHATFVPSINHNKDVALLSYVELYLNLTTVDFGGGTHNIYGQKSLKVYLQH